MWRKAARGGFDIFVVPGEHHHAFEEPDAAGVAEILRRFIDSTRGDRVR
jgi:thioesterase domain-containing protein